MNLKWLMVGWVVLMSAAFAQDRTGISVTGSGTVYGEPDIATVELGVNIANQSLEIATNEANAVITKLMDTLKASGIDAKDIRTSYFNIWVDQGYNPEGELMTPTYRVGNTLMVTIRDISKVGAILSQSIAAGANAVNSVQYSIADTTKLAEQARALAVQDARARAEHLAKLAGVSLGELVMVNDVSGGPVYAVAAGPMAAMGAETIPVSGGTLAVTVMIELRYTLGPKN
jgi:hypothetical protein